MTRGDQHKSTPSIAEMERDIAETREQLGAIVEELAAKADVPARAKAKASDAKAKASDAKAKASDTAARVRAEASDTASRVRATFHRSSDGHTDGHADGTTADPAAVSAGRTRQDGQAGSEGPGPMPAGAPMSGSAAGTARTARTKGPHRPAEDRTLYAMAAVSLTAATVVAARWAKQHGDFGG